MQAIEYFHLKTILPLKVSTFSILNSAKTVECLPVVIPIGKQTSQAIGTEIFRQINKSKHLFLSKEVKFRICAKNLH